MSALIQGGFSADSLGRKNIDKISNYLAQNLRGQGGLLGTSRCFGPRKKVNTNALASSFCGSGCRQYG